MEHAMLGGSLAQPGLASDFCPPLGLLHGWFGLGVRSWMNRLALD